MAIDEKILDELIAGYKKPEDLIGENGLLKELTRAAVGTGNECGDDGASWS